MADDDYTKLPPLENWASQTFAYGWLLDRSAASDYTNQSSQSTIFQPQPDDMHLLNLNPQSISVDEPIATAIAASQGGGKVIESRGGVFKSISVRGTTGFLPPIAPHAKHMSSTASAFSLSNPTLEPLDIISALKSTGFFEFYHLRRLFRQFMKERRLGKVVNMHWCDFKGDEFWHVEPKRFRLDRTRFSYTYDIGFDLIEPSQVVLGAAANLGFDTSRFKPGIDRGISLLQLFRNPLNVTFDSVVGAALTRVTQLTANANAFIQNFSLGVLNAQLAGLVSLVNSIQSFFSTIAAIKQGTLDTPLTLYMQVYSSLQAIQNSFLTTVPVAFQADVNEWLIEMQFMVEGLVSYHQTTFGTTPGQAMSDANDNFTQQRASQGTVGQFIQEQTSDSASPTVDPFLGASGFDLIGNLQKMLSTTTLRADSVLTGENIFDVAQRCLGDAGRFLDLIILNQLQAPYIVASIANKPDGTIAWGQPIYVPTSDPSASLAVASPISPVTAAFSATDFTLSADLSTIIVDTSLAPWRVNMWSGFTVEITSGALLGEKRVIVSNTANTLIVNRAYVSAVQVGVTFNVYLQVFSARQPVSAETVAFGRDIMAVFTRTDGLFVDGTIDCMLSPLKDLATVAGLENLSQAIAVRLATPFGSDKSNPTYGTVSMVGRPFEPNVVALHVFYVRQSLLQDPRIDSVEQPTVTFAGTALYFSCYVRPVRVQRTLFFRIPLG